MGSFKTTVFVHIVRMADTRSELPEGRHYYYSLGFDSVLVSVVLSLIQMEFLRCNLTKSASKVLFFQWAEERPGTISSILKSGSLAMQITL